MSVSSGQSIQKKWSALFGVWMLHGVIALWQFLSLPSDGVSPQRILMNELLFAWIVFSLILSVSVFRQSLWLHKLLDQFNKPSMRDGVFIAAVLAVFLRICLTFLLELAAQSASFKYEAYAERLSPLLDLIAFVFIEIIALNLFFVFRDRPEYKSLFKALLTRMLVILAFLGVLIFYISKTDMGIAPIYKGDWARGLPAVPLLEWQIILACLFCMGMVFVEADGKILKIPRLDLWISLAIGLATIAFWLSQPTVPNASALEPHEPNFEIYPFIDAQTYDKFAQSVLIGNGFGVNEIPQRPLYIVFLVFIHALVGQSYNSVIAVQTLFFAAFPVLLYLFGREFFGRPIGISIALLAVLRDYTSNLVSPFTGNISYSKLYLSEIPTAIFLILFLLIGIRWIKSGFPIYLGFLLGGILGIGMLNRTQVVVALPVLLFFAFLVEPKKIPSMIKGTLPALAIIALIIAPWLWRNWQMTGQLIFDNPGSQTANLALRYNRLNGENVDILPIPGESNSSYNDRMLEMANHAMSVNPMGIVKAVASSFINHGINNILLFPLRNDLKGIGELWTPTTPFWQQWEGRPNLSQGMLLGFYIFLFSLGLAIAWHRNGLLGLLPLMVNLAYNLWTSLALLSGQRFMLSMDWSIILYYMIGIFSLLSILFFALESGRLKILNWYELNAVPISSPVESITWQQYVFAGLIFFGVGASLPLSEMAFPKRYPTVQLNQPNESTLLPSLAQANLEPGCFQKLVDSNGLEIVRGRAVYPRYYEAGDGEIFTDAAGYKIVDEGRLVFEMVGQRNNRVIFPMPQAPDFFPNASDVTLWFDKNNSPWFVLVEQGDVHRFYISESANLSACE
jgi:hypothetical protein